jgi:hypothetical protein
LWQLDCWFEPVPLVAASTRRVYSRFFHQFIDIKRRFEKMFLKHKNANASLEIEFYALFPTMMIFEIPCPASRSFLRLDVLAFPDFLNCP